MLVKNKNELGLLLAKRSLLGHAAEVGVAEGRTALQMLRWGFSKVYLIDMWKHVPKGRGGLGHPQKEQEATLADCKKRTQQFQDQIVFLQGWSYEMANRIPDESLDYLHIDASHDYKNVKRDLNCYWPKLRSDVGAIVCLHDYSNPSLGVKKATHEFMDSVGATDFHILLGGCETDASIYFEKGEML